MKRALAALALALPALAAAGVRPAPCGTIRIGLPAAPATLAPGTAERPVDVLVERATSAPLLEIDAAGRLAPGALAEVPVPEAEARAFRLRLRPGLRAASGRPLGAADVAAHLTSLLQARPAPHAWVALPILGAEAVIEGRTPLLAGVQVLSAFELLVTLAFPFPAFPWLLATPAAALPEAGPFAPVPRRSPLDPLLLVANEHHHAGRPFAREIELHAVDPRGAARLLEKGGLDLVLRPEAAGGRAGPALPTLTATVAVVNGARLGPGAPPIRGALRALDRSELARRFVRGPATAMPALVPPAVLPGLPAGSAGPEERGGPAPARVVLLAQGAAPESRALAERIQVKLFDAGVRAAVELADGARFRTRLDAGDYDVALVSVPIASPQPALAAAQLAYVARGAAAARRAFEALGPATPPGSALDAADGLARELDLVPLVASGVRASLGPRLQGLAPGADGAVDLAGLWLLGGGVP
ncbi:MAG TPA: ABC transporter substrate-binding protein [Anaeromyxobacter sp.]